MSKSRATVIEIEHHEDEDEDKRKKRESVGAHQSGARRWKQRRYGRDRRDDQGKGGL